MNGLVFLNVVAHAAPNGKEFSNNAKFGAQKEHCLTCFQMQLFKPIALSRNSSLKIKKNLTFCSLLTRSTIPGACHAKRHLNVQKWREHVVFLTFWLRNVLRATTACTFSTPQLLKAEVICTFWLRNVLRATTACTFSTSQLPKVVWTWVAFSFFTCKYASHHNGVQFFISHPASWLRTLL